MKLPRQARLQSRREFLTIQNSGEKWSGRFLLLFTRRGTTTSIRGGFTISRRVDKRAAVRNRIRRRLREVYRLNRSRLAPEFDFVVVAKGSAVRASFSELERDLLGAFTKAGLVR